MIEIELRLATRSDLVLLARMNRELIEDERHLNPATQAELHERFEQFIDAGWTPDLFLLEGGVVGYALHRREANPAAPGGHETHLRQFFVIRGRRRENIGQRALKVLCRTRWQAGERIVLDVLETNPGGRRFWDRMGFKPYYTRLERPVSG
jgi:GNAT superfamily N-acetyltransferase